MTLKLLLADCYRRLGYEPSPDVRVATRIKAFLNETQQELSGDPALATLLRGSLTLTTSASRAEYGLPPALSRVRAIRETTTNRRLSQVSVDWYRWAVPNPAQMGGTPDAYALLGPMAVSRQPSDASSLYAVSTSNSDTPILHYEVRTSDGYVTTSTVTLAGTTAQTLSSTLTTIEEVLDWYLDAEAIGTVTLREDSAVGTELARIPPGHTRSTYQGIAFVPTPAAAITYQVDYEHQMSDLVVDLDEPLWMPERFHTLLAMGARMKEYEFKDDATRYRAALNEYGAHLARLKSYVNGDPDRTVIPGGRRSGRSDLGGWYPAGTVFD